MAVPIETTCELSANDAAAVTAVLAKVGAHWSVGGRPFRDSYDALMEDTPVAAGVSLVEVEDGPIRGWWVRHPNASNDKAIVHFHGGGYHMGSAKSYRGFVSQIVCRVGVHAFIPDYPLAPERPFPAAYDYAVATLMWVQRAEARHLALTGDSAGGGLALAAATAAIDKSDAIRAIAVFSPYVDLAFAGNSFADCATFDPILQRGPMSDRAAVYLDGTDPHDGRASPLYAVPTGLPPTLIQVGENELLRDDARRYAVLAAEKGAEVHLDIFQGLHHVFQISVDDLPNARRALDRTATFLKDKLMPGGSQS